jgi:hypothetical protein
MSNDIDEMPSIVLEDGTINPRFRVVGRGTIAKKNRAKYATNEEYVVSIINLEELTRKSKENK